MRKIIALGLAMAGMGAWAEPKQRRNRLDEVSLWAAPVAKVDKKPNKVSQSKRRKYARQGRSK